MIENTKLTDKLQCPACGRDFEGDETLRQGDACPSDDCPSHDNKKTKPVIEMGHWDEHPDHPIGDWKLDVENNDTRLGYWDWVKQQPPHPATED